MYSGGPKVMDGESGGLGGATSERRAGTNESLVGSHELKGLANDMSAMRSPLY